MKYYSERECRQLRVGFEAAVLQWPGVTTKKMFGCPAYQAAGKLFAFLVTDGIVITNLDPEEREALSRQIEIAPFRTDKRTIRNWARISIVEPEKELDRLFSFVRKSYESALKTA